MVSSRWEMLSFWRVTVEAFAVSIIVSVVSIVVFIPFESLDQELSPSPSIADMPHPLFGFLLFICIVPFFETLIFQSFPRLLLSRFRYFRVNEFIMVAVSGVCFGVLHCYSLSYMFQMTMVGMFFMYLYLRRGVRGDAIFVVWVVHGLRNCIPFSIELLKLG